MCPYSHCTIVGREGFLSVIHMVATMNKTFWPVKGLLQLQKCTKTDLS